MTKEQQTPIEKTTVDNLGEAISVLVQAVNIAQAKGGVYNFGDAAKIHSALQFVTSLQKSQNAPEGPAVATIETDKTVAKK